MAEVIFLDQVDLFKIKFSITNFIFYNELFLTFFGAPFKKVRVDFYFSLDLFHDPFTFKDQPYFLQKTTLHLHYTPPPYTPTPLKNSITKLK